MNDFLGVGWVFPVCADSSGSIALARGETDIEQAIRIILLTPKGQRVLRPDFGCQIHDLIFAPNNAATAGLAAHYAEEALAMWEPRIAVQNVETFRDTTNDGCLRVEIQYQIKATHDQRSLVFPFYRIPEE